MDKNINGSYALTPEKEKQRKKTGGFIGKVLKKHHFKLRKSNKIIFVFKN